MPKRLIVCCDGTWNTADQAIAGHLSPTNVTKLALSVAPEDSAGARQCVYYHSGVGTSRWERLSGGAFGAGLGRNVFDAYRFLIDNYESGDWLFLFGFSRGAFTAPQPGRARLPVKKLLFRPDPERLPHHPGTGSSSAQITLAEQR